MPIPSFEVTEELKFTDWNDFKLSLFDKIRDKQEPFMPAGVAGKAHWKRKFIFRGQTCASWALTSSFDRIMKIKGYDDVRPRYDELIRRFKTLCQEIGLLDREMDNFLQRESRNGGAPDSLFIEALAQHRGLPTRLLDWTQSPYIASFFAFIGTAKECSSGSVSIWCLDVDGTKDSLETKDGMFIEETPFNNRQVWQRGLFTLNKTKFHDTDSIFKKDSPFFHKHPKFPLLFKAIIPFTERERAIQDLDMMRINYITLFPDVEGLVRHLRDEVEAGR